jgi:hypothetical protein
VILWICRNGSMGLQILILHNLGTRRQLVSVAFTLYDENEMEFSDRKDDRLQQLREGI